KALITDGVKLVVLGRGERLADLPEIKALADRSSLDLLARSLDYDRGTKLLVVAEENVTANPGQPNVGDNQVIRVLAGAVHHVAGTRPIDPDWETRPRSVWQQYELRVKRLDERVDQRLKDSHDQALAAGKWKGTSAVQDRASYWIAGVLAYFGAAGHATAPAGGEHAIVTREALQNYDPEL